MSYLCQFCKIPMYIEKKKSNIRYNRMNNVSTNFLLQSSLKVNSKNSHVAPSKEHSRTFFFIFYVCFWLTVQTCRRRMSTTTLFETRTDFQRRVNANKLNLFDYLPSIKANLALFCFVLRKIFCFI